MAMTELEITMTTAAMRGNSKAFEELYGLYYKKVFALARMTVRNESDAEDILQQAFINAWRNINRLADPAAFNTWIQKITLNLCYSLLRKKNIAILLDAESDIDDIDDIESDEFLPAVYAERDDLKERLGRIIDGLSEVQKQTVILYYFNEFKVEEIAQVMECNTGTVKTRLFLARKTIRTEIEEQERRSGQKFYGVAGIPMLALGRLLAQQIEMHVLSPAVSSGILRSISQSIMQGAPQVSTAPAGGAGAVPSSGGYAPQYGYTNSTFNTQHSASYGSAESNHPGASRQPSVEGNMSAAYNQPYAPQVGAYPQSAAGVAGAAVKAGLPLVTKIIVVIAAVAVVISGGLLARHAVNNNHSDVYTPTASNRRDSSPSVPESTLPATTQEQPAATNERSVAAAIEDVENTGTSPSLTSMPISPYSSISAGSTRTMAIKNDGTLWAWGDNGGQLGDGTTTNRGSPVKIMDNVIYVSVGGGHSMAIKDDGSLWGWGNNGSGQLGDGTTTSRYEPVKIMDDVIQVAVGGSHTLAIKSDGALWVWGSHYYGQLGDGSNPSTEYQARRPNPAKIMDNVVQVSAGESFSMALKSDGSLWVWGRNDHGQIGDINGLQLNSPVKVMSDVKYISAGFSIALAIKNDGSLWGWGNNRRKQLGVDTGIDQYTPVKIMEGASSVSAGVGHVMVIKDDGSLWAIGDNMSGQLGDGTRENSSVPKKIMDDVALISAGGDHSTAIRADGSFWAWGSNGYMQIGNGTYESQLKPMKVMDNVFE